MEQAGESLYGTYVGEQSEALAHGQQALLGADGCRGVVVVARVADGREEHSISSHARLKRLFRKRVANFIYGISAANGVFVGHVVVETSADSRHHLDALAADFGAYTIARQYSNSEIHKCLWIVSLRIGYCILLVQEFAQHFSCPAAGCLVGHEKRGEVVGEAKKEPVGRRALSLRLVGGLVGRGHGLMALLQNFGS